MILSYNCFEVRRDYMATNEKSRVTVAITAEMNEKLREEAKKRGLSISAVVTLALEDYLKK